MYKILLPFCIMGCVSTHAFAENTLFSMLEHKHSNIQKAQDTINKNNNTNYTDFSGKWSGTCTSGDGETPTVTTEIHSDEFGISVDGRSMRFHEVTSTLSSNEQGYANNQVKLYWDDSGRVLTLDLVYVYSAHGSAKEMDKDIGKVTLTLNNGDLVTESNIHRSDASEDEHQNCVFKKQQ